MLVCWTVQKTLYFEYIMTSSFPNMHTSAILPSLWLGSSSLETGSLRITRAGIPSEPLAWSVVSLSHTISWVYRKHSTTNPLCIPHTTCILTLSRQELSIPITFRRAFDWCFKCSIDCLCELYRACWSCERVLLLLLSSAVAWSLIILNKIKLNRWTNYSEANIWKIHILIHNI